MKLMLLKFSFVLVFAFLSVEALAWTNDYVSVFKPIKEAKTVMELQKGIQKDFAYIRSVINFNEKKIIGLVKSEKDIKSTRSPAEI